MIEIRFPDGSKRLFNKGITGLELAEKISRSLAKKSVAMELDGKIVDLQTHIIEDATIRFITTQDPEAMEILRHSAAHVMAEAIVKLYPGAKLAIGPAIEDGFYYDIDMSPVSEEDFKSIEREMEKSIKAKRPFVRKEVTKEKALELYKDEPYKLEMLSELEEGTISIYEHGDFSDLCRGPHLPHTGFIKAFKLTKVSGAYWRGDPDRAQLQRIYGVAFFDKKAMDEYLHFLEEAKRRNHRKIGEALDLFSFHEEAPGMAFFHAKGMVIWNTLMEYWREEHRDAGYVEIKTPVILNRHLWERSGHWENYRENMYTTVVDESEYAIKPMNCPGGMLVYKSRPHSYRELPLRAAELGLVHRHELSGVLAGLFRVRAFHQDDAHLFMTEEQIQSEILGVLKLTERLYSRFGLGFHLELSTRPKKSIGTDAQWETATSGLKNALLEYGRPFKINEGDGAFYGPKIDCHIEDALKRTWQCGTIQLDMSLPERFDLTYVDRDNERKRPIMIHRTVFGSIERFLGILIEHFAGRFPLWLAPVQAVILPINDELVPYACMVGEKLQEAGIRCETDSRSESLNRKIRDAQLSMIPLMLTIGERERKDNVLAVRGLSGKVRFGIDHGSFIDKVTDHIRERRLDSDLFE